MRITVTDDNGVPIFHGTLESDGDHMHIETVTIGGTIYRRARIVSSEILVRARDGRIQPGSRWPPEAVD